MMQLTFNKSGRWPAQKAGTQAPQRRRLADLHNGETGVLESMDVPADVARRLMELGFLPGHSVTPAHSAPGGDPRVFRVDGSEIALRRDTASRLWVAPARVAAD
jgi:Fe2+ transport system protein FeoA